jgi:hypothetical protein
MRHILMIGFLMAALCTEAGAQAPRVEPGDRVKVRPSPATSDAVLIVAAVDSQTLTLVGERTRREVTVPLESIRTLHRSVGRPGLGSSVGKGAGFGFVAGFAAGAAFGILLADESHRMEAALVLGGIGGGIGAGVGALTGAAVRTEQWERVEVGRRIVLAPTGRGAVVGMLITF